MLNYWLVQQYGTQKRDTHSMLLHTQLFSYCFPLSLLKILYAHFRSFCPGDCLWLFAVWASWKKIGHEMPPNGERSHQLCGAVRFTLRIQHTHTEFKWKRKSRILSLGLRAIHVFAQCNIVPVCLVFWTNSRWLGTVIDDDFAQVSRGIIVRRDFRNSYFSL